MSQTYRDYRLSGAGIATADGWMARSLLLVNDAEYPITEKRLREHLTAVHARLADKLGGFVDRGAAPGRRDERELRFMIDELIEALHRLQDLELQASSVVS